MRILLAILTVLLVGLAPSGVARAQYVMDIGSLIGAIEVGDLSGAVEGVNRANRVYVARVTELAGIRVAGERLSQVVSGKARVLGYFRSAIRGAKAARKALDVHGQVLEQVIFATYTADNTATLYVDDR